MLSKLFYIALAYVSGIEAVEFLPLSEKPGLIDKGTFGPELQVVHLFHKDPPIGVAVSKSGRAFVTFNRGDLVQSPITVGEIINSSEEVAFPTLELNTPPDGLVNTTSGRPTGSSDSGHFINVQAVVIDAKERLWALDTGRPVINGDNPLAAPGGPKLMGFDLESNASVPFTTITFLEDVLPPTGYLNDVRFDLTPSLTKSGQGVAYIADSGGFGIIVVDLGTGRSWRHLDRLRSVSATSRFLPNIFGTPTYLSTPMMPALSYEIAGGGGGCDGFSISADGKHIYFTALASRDLHSVETAALRVDPADDNLAFIRAANSVQFLGEFGGQADGFESDNTGKIYLTNVEHNSINTFDPTTGLVSPFVRSPIIAWPDTLNVADDGFIYATLNQLWLSPGFQNGTDKRVKPFALVRAKINGGKVKLM